MKFLTPSWGQSGNRTDSSMRGWSELQAALQSYICCCWHPWISHVELSQMEKDSAALPNANFLEEWDVGVNKHLESKFKAITVTRVGLLGRLKKLRTPAQKKNWG